MSLLNVPSTPFPPIFSSPTASRTPLTASLTRLTSIRLNPCATLLWGWTIWSSDRSDPKHSSRHMFWPLHPGAASERTGVLVPVDSVVASKVWTEHLVARTCFSVLSCRACPSTFNPHMHMRVAQGLRCHRSCVLPRCALNYPSRSMLHKTLLGVPDTFSSFGSSPPQTTPTSRPLTGIRRTPCATSLEREQSGHLADPLPHTGYEPKSCIDIRSEHTPINYPSRRNSFNIENDLTTTVAAYENSDCFQQQAAASGSSQHVSASEVNPWFGADMWARTRKPVRGNVSNVSVEETLSKRKRDRDLESVQSLSERHILQVYLEQKAEMAVRGECAAQRR